MAIWHCHISTYVSTETLSLLVSLFEEIMLWNVYTVVMEHWARNPELLTIKEPFDPVNEANLCYNDHHIKQIILNFTGKKKWWVWRVCALLHNWLGWTQSLSWHSVKLLLSTVFKLKSWAELTMIRTRSYPPNDMKNTINSCSCLHMLQ